VELYYKKEQENNHQNRTRTNLKEKAKYQAVESLLHARFISHESGLKKY